ncbi:hypothetical protein MBANPS3_008575 [Mucor bainieri]
MDQLRTYWNLGECRDSNTTTNRFAPTSFTCGVSTLPDSKKGERQSSTGLVGLRSHSVPVPKADNGSQQDGESVRNKFLVAKSPFAELAQYGSAQCQSLAMNETKEKLDPVFLERRNMHRGRRFETFDRGTPYEALQWLDRFEALADYFGYTDQEKTKELMDCLKGYAYNRLIDLEPPAIKQNWDKVKQEFLQGKDPALIAFRELEGYTRGDKSMASFGLGLENLLQRAGFQSPGIQLEFLKDRLPPKLERAVILSGAATLREGIRIADEIERFLARRSKEMPVATTEGCCNPGIQHRKSTGKQGGEEVQKATSSSKSKNRNTGHSSYKNKGNRN